MKKTRQKINVPKATMKRYPIYLKALRKLQSQGVERILSKELAEYCDIQATTIRRDFSFIGSLGKQGYGYDVNHVVDIFDDLLGTNYDEEIIIVGVGNLGKALLNYNRWGQVVGEIVCGFDSVAKKVGKINGIPIYHIDDLEEKIPEHCRVAIVTVPQSVQETVNKLVEVGIKGIVDFSHDHVQAPKGVIIKQVDVVSAIQELVFQSNNLD